MLKQTKFRQPHLLQHLCVLLGSVVLFFIQGPEFVYHLWDHLYDGGDSFINSWILAWNAHALFLHDVSVWDAPIFYPVQNALTFSETMFGNLWITIPIQYLTNNPTFAANMLLLASFVFGMYFVFLLVRDLTGSFWSGLIAGVVFSFNPYRWGHVPHLQLLPFFWAPLALFFANRLINHPKKRYFFGMLIVTWIQYYASIYLGTMLLVLLIVLFLVHLILERKGPERWVYFTDSGLRTMLVAGLLLSALLLLPLGLPYMKTAKAWHFVRTLEDNAAFSAEPLSFLLRAPNFASYGWLNHMFDGRIRGGEGAVFLGLTPWLLAILGLVMIRRQRSCLNLQQKQVTRRYAWAALIIGILMLGPYLIFFNHNTGVPMPYQLIYYLVPGARAMRVPARFVQPLLLCLVVVGGFGTVALWDLWRRWGAIRKVVTILFLAALFRLDYAVCDNQGVLAETRDRFPPVYSYLANAGKERPVLELPVVRRGDNWHAYKYLHYQTAHWRPLLSGVSGWLPPGRLAISKYTRSCPSTDCLRFIGLAPAMTLVVHLDRYSDAERLSWQAADLSPYGFKLMDQMGNAMVWEREYDNQQLSAKLAIVWPEVRVEQNDINVNLFLRPSEKGRHWRNLIQGWTDISVSIITRQGGKSNYSIPVKVPPYILPGEKVMVGLPRIEVVGEDIVSLHFEGLLFDDYTVNYMGTPFAIKAANGHYVCAEGGGRRKLVANQDAIGEWEVFKLVDLGDNQVAFRAANGHYVCAEGGGGRELVANRDVIGEWEAFEQVDLGDNQVALRVADGQYVSAKDGDLVANRNSIGTWETFDLIKTDNGYADFSR